MQIIEGDFTGGVLSYESAEQLGELRARFADSHVVMRRGSQIIIAAFDVDAAVVGDETRFTALHDLEIVMRLVERRLVWLLTREWGYLLRREAPPKFISRRPERDLLMQASNGCRLGGLHVYPQYTLDVRHSGPRNSPGIVLGIKARYELTRPVADLLGAGVNIEGKHVLTIQEDQLARPYHDPDARRRLAGLVIAVRGDRLVIDTPDGREEVATSEAWLEARREVFDEVLAALAGSRHGEIARRLEEKVFGISGAEGRLALTTQLAGWLGRKTIAVVPGVEVRIQPPIGAGEAGANVAGRRIEEPVFAFDLGGEKTHRSADKGLEAYGPFDSEMFSPTRPRIAVITPRGYQGSAEQFMAAFRNGVPGRGGFSQGFARKYRLTDCEISILSFDGGPLDASAYRRACLAATADGEPPHLAVVITSEAQQHLVGDASPYLVAKSRFMSQGIPVQEVQIETIQRDDTASVLNTMALACYAKLGGTPFVMRVHARPMAHELVIGIGSAHVRTSRMSTPERYVGITTVFTSDGNYLLATASKEAPYEQYPQELLASLRASLENVKARNNWQPTDTLRLIFHVFKPFKDQEARAVKSLVEVLASQYAGVEFAFVHVSDEHEWTMFDRAAEGLTRSGRVRGRCVPARGHAVRVGHSEMLVSVTGPYDMKLPLQGVPRPLLLKLHRESTFTDLDYLAAQAFRFTAVSWRRFYPCRTPVTILYSDLIANLLGQLRHVTNWNSDMISTKLRDKRWFL
ncbi:MAG TPA: Piwi domain-containing protein [Actinospica sp.]|nr:Piwi domain-containing protein [Actinospica sp.]